MNVEDVIQTPDSEEAQMSSIFEWTKEPITEYIYIISCGEDSPVKVGYTQNVSNRLDELQVGNPYLLQVEAAIPGNERCEGILHEQFYGTSIRGEWFWPTNCVKEAIRKMAMLERQLQEYRHSIRWAVENRSGEQLVDIVPGIKPYDIIVED